MQTTIERQLLSVRETAKVLGVSERTVWTMTVPRGRLVCCRLGSRVMYSAAAIKRFIEQQEASDESE